MTNPRVLITAGPTHEPIDSVRYIANRSSGRMGIALAEASCARGWPTTLLLGPTHHSPRNQPLLHLQRFRTTADLQLQLREQWPLHDLLIMAAAVADYRVANVRTSKRPNVEPSEPEEVPGPIAPSSKLRRSPTGLILELEPTPDLLAELSSMTKPGQHVVGFALEPEDRLLASAREKLTRKRLDAIVANPLDTMDSPTIAATVLWRDGRELQAPGEMSKDDFVRWLLAELDSMIR